MLYAKDKHDTRTCGKLATFTMDKRRLVDAKSAAVGETDEVEKILSVAYAL